MLYDNAELALTYLHGYLVTGETEYHRICEETLDFVLRELTLSEGGCFSSLDSDSEGEEGKFYIWTQDEVEGVLGSDFDFFKTAFGITLLGNWEGKIILQHALDDSTLAARLKMEQKELRQKLSTSHARLLEERSSRIRPRHQ